VTRGMTGLARAGVERSQQDWPKVLDELAVQGHDP
jgi:hypothetical protein